MTQWRRQAETREVEGSGPGSPPPSCPSYRRAGPSPVTGTEKCQCGKIHQILITSSLCDGSRLLITAFLMKAGTVANQISVLIKSFIKADHLITRWLMPSLLSISRYYMVQAEAVDPVPRWFRRRQSSPTVLHRGVMIAP